MTACMMRAASAMGRGTWALGDLVVDARRGVRTCLVIPIAGIGAGIGETACVLPWGCRNRAVMPRMQRPAQQQGQAQLVFEAEKATA